MSLERAWSERDSADEGDCEEDSDNSVALAATVVVEATTEAVSGGEFSSFASALRVESVPAAPSVSGTVSTVERSRGRPPGSSDRSHHQPDAPPMAMGSIGHVLTLHVFFVKAGEDVSAKIMAFAQSDNWNICVLSSNGTIAAAALLHQDAYGGTRVYEGTFEILSLSGYFLHSEIGGLRARSGNLTVSLSSSDGYIFGGPVGGVLIAANPVQVVLGSFDT